MPAAIALMAAAAAGEHSSGPREARNAPRPAKLCLLSENMTIHARNRAIAFLKTTNEAECFYADLTQSAFPPKKGIITP